MKKIDRARAAYKKGSVNSSKEEKISTGKNGFIKTSIKPQSKAPAAPVPPVSDNPPCRDSPLSAGYAKAAKFLLLVGPDQAAEVLKHFSEEDIEKIVKEIASVSKIKKSDSQEILKEFNYIKRKKESGNSSALTGPVTGGAERAREILIAALGAEKGDSVFNKVLPFGGRRPFDFLNELNPDQILMIIKNEPPYVLSTVLSFLEPRLSSRIVKSLPSESRKEIVMRIARQGEVAPGIIEKMEGIFRDRMRAQGKVVNEEVDGKSVLADILKYMDLRTEEDILDKLTDGDRNLAGEIRERIYTIDILLKMEDRDIQYLLRDFDNSELAVIIKGKPDDIKARILNNISERRRLLVEEESFHLGEMLRSDVDKSTRELINYLIDLEQKGRINIPRGDEEYI